MAPKKLSEISFSNVFFIHQDDDGDVPMFVGTYKYDGKIHPKSEVKNLMKNPAVRKLFKDYEDEDECIFQVVRTTVGKSHYTKPICTENANVFISAGNIRV